MRFLLTMLLRLQQKMRNASEVSFSGDGNANDVKELAALVRVQLLLLMLVHLQVPKLLLLPPPPLQLLLRSMLFCFSC